MTAFEELLTGDAALLRKAVAEVVADNAAMLVHDSADGPPVYTLGPDEHGKLAILGSGEGVYCDVDTSSLHDEVLTAVMEEYDMDRDTVMEKLTFVVEREEMLTRKVCGELWVQTKAAAALREWYEERRLSDAWFLPNEWPQ